MLTVITANNTTVIAKTLLKDSLMREPNQQPPNLEIKIAIEKTVNVVG